MKVNEDGRGGYALLLSSMARGSGRKQRENKVSNTFYVSNMDVESGLRWTSASNMS